MKSDGFTITPRDHALVIIITGEEGLTHGYADRYRPDGVIEYFGVGQTGDMVARGRQLQARGDLSHRRARFMSAAGTCVITSWRAPPAIVKAAANRRRSYAVMARRIWNRIIFAG